MVYSTRDVGCSACLIDKHQEYPLTHLHGDGSSSSSDADRYSIQKSSILASYYPLLWGRRKRVLGVYTHISDQPLRDNSTSLKNKYE